MVGGHFQPGNEATHQTGGPITPVIQGALVIAVMIGVPVRLCMTHHEKRLQDLIRRESRRCGEDPRVGIVGAIVVEVGDTDN